MTAHRKVVLIGIDAGDPDLIRRWAAAGALPTWRALLSEAAWGVMHAPRGFYTGAVWPSFATAVSPATHGIHCFRQLVPGSYRELPPRPEDLAAEPFWEALGRDGKRVAVIDVPRIGLSRRVSGLQLVDWGTHDPVLRRPRSSPASLAREVETRFGREPVGDCEQVDPSPAGALRLRDHLLERARTKAALSAQLRRLDDWDLFATVFCEAHCAGHQLWHLHDPTHPRHDARARASIGDPLEAVYREIDAGIGRLLDEIPPDHFVCVMGSHGIGPHYEATFLLDEVLSRLDGMPPAAGAGLFSRVNGIWKRAPRALHRLSGRLDTHYKHWIRAGLLARDRRRRRFFAVSNNETHPGIRINRIGREPAGRVAPGDEFDRVCAELTRELEALVNADTGEPAVQEVLRTRELYHGPLVDRLPDLVAVWNPSAPIRRLRSPRIGSVEGDYLGVRTGDHRRQGLFAIRGPGLRPGRIDRPVSVMDLAPTLCALLGAPLKAVEGRPIAEVCPRA